MVDKDDAWALEQVMRRIESPWYLRCARFLVQALISVALLPFAAALAALTGPLMAARWSPTAAVVLYRAFVYASWTSFLATCVHLLTGRDSPNLVAWLLLGYAALMFLKEVTVRGDAEIRRRRNRRDTKLAYLCLGGPLSVGAFLALTAVGNPLLRLFVSVGVVVLGVVYSFLIAKTKPSIESTRNMKVYADSSLPFVLWLRPFVDRELQENPSEMKVPVPTHGVVDLAAFSLIQDIEDALEGKAVVVAIGPIFLPRPDLLVKSIVAVTEDRDWRNCVREVAASAQAVLITPGASAGIADEIRLLVEAKLLDRVLVLMPPSLASVDLRSGQVASIQDRSAAWERVRAELLEAGIAKLPEYDHGGLVYSPDEDFGVKESVRLDEVAARGGGESEGIARVDMSLALEHALPEILRNLPSDWSPVKDVIPILKRFDQPAKPHALTFYTPRASGAETQESDRNVP